MKFILALAFLATATQAENFRRTVVFVERHTHYGQDLFIQGGRAGCVNEEGEGADCDVPVILAEKSSQLWGVYEGARRGGVENLTRTSAPGEFGLPAIWTTNDPNNERNVVENEYGIHFWMVDMLMDCDATENGFFAFNAVIEENGYAQDWEKALEQPHFGRCGYRNLVTFNTPRLATIDFIPGEMYETTIFIEKYTSPGMNLFINGGSTPTCGSEVVSDDTEATLDRSSQCACPDSNVDVILRELNQETWAEYGAWSVGATTLSWCPLENQGTYAAGDFNIPAVGLPGAWTTNDQESQTGIVENVFGEHHWYFGMKMDCSQLANEDGSFYFRATLSYPGYMEDQVEEVVHRGLCDGVTVVKFNQASDGEEQDITIEA